MSLSVCEPNVPISGIHMVIYFLGARFPGHCPASIKRVYNGDFGEDEDSDTLDEHGCYIYRLLHGLEICGENTEKTFARLLRRCREGKNFPMCRVAPVLSDDGVGGIAFCSAHCAESRPKQIMEETLFQGISRQASLQQENSVVEISSPEPEHVCWICHLSPSLDPTLNGFFRLSRRPFRLFLLAHVYAQECPHLRV